MKKIEELTEEINSTVQRLENQIERLREENKKLKEGIWKEEEVARLKERYEEMSEDYYRGFPITEEEKKKIDRFKAKYSGQYHGACGGAFRYEFTPTGLGTIGTIIGPDGKSLVFQTLG